MTTKVQAIVQDVRNYFDNKVEGLSQSEYLDVIHRVSGILDGYADCVRDEMADEMTEEGET
jgi:hypothetical protein